MIGRTGRGDLSPGSLLSAVPRHRLHVLGAARDVALELATKLYWVGGGVRDLLRGELDLDLDLVIDGAAGIERFGRALAQRLGATASFHPRFLTCELRAPELGRLDVASARRETYAHPAMLPDVFPASLAEDLARRDFTVNSLAIPLAPEFGGALVDLHGGRADLAAGRLRVLHARSFLDDPTRLLRGAGFEARFGFRFDLATESVAREAIDSGVVELVSGERLADALGKATAHPEAIAAALRRLDELAFLPRLVPGLGFGRVQAERLEAARREMTGLPGTSGAAAEWGPRLALLELAWELSPGERRRLGERLALRVELRDSVLSGPDRIAHAAGILDAAPSPSGAHAALASLDRVELARLACESPQAREWVRRELAEFRQLALRINGDDLRRHGVASGPALGRALARTLEARLDGAVDEAGELEHALHLAREVER